jgi:transposase
MAPGRIVAVDDLSAHKIFGIRQCLENAGMPLLHLAPYSPACNPVERVFSKFKALLRQAAARSFDAICDALETILEKFKPAECAN